MSHLIAIRHVIVLLVLFLGQLYPAEAQLCQLPVVPPFMSGELSVTANFSGSVDVFPDEYTSCGNYTTPENSVWLGLGGNFVYSISFSLPVNNVVIILNATGQTQNENFIFTSNGGTPSINMVSGCYSSVSGNQILSGLNADPASLGGGGQFIISAPNDFTELTITGDGGSAGSLFALCADGLIPTAPSPCAAFLNSAGPALPNIITPNGDGLNDVWGPTALYAECFEYTCSFFNRWGEEVYKTDPTTSPFAGKDASGNELSEGNYLYVFNSQGKTWHGFVTIIR